jgi:hypothetical protein
LLLKGRKNALTMLPETEPLRRKAEVAVQVFKDFQFQINDGFEAEARKTVNMVQEWQTPDKYDLAALGIEPWIAKARQQAVKVLNLVAVRVDNESAKVKNSASREQSQACLSYAEAQPVFARKGKGELADARKATDAAIRQAFDVLNALPCYSPAPNSRSSSRPSSALRSAPSSTTSAAARPPATTPSPSRNPSRSPTRVAMTRAAKGYG